MLFSDVDGKGGTINSYQHLYHNQTYKQMLISLLIVKLSTPCDNSVDKPFRTRAGHSVKKKIEFKNKSAESN